MAQAYVPIEEVSLEVELSSGMIPFYCSDKSMLLIGILYIYVCM